MMTRIMIDRMIMIRMMTMRIITMKIILIKQQVMIMINRDTTISDTITIRSQGYDDWLEKGSYPIPYLDFAGVYQVCPWIVPRNYQGKWELRRERERERIQKKKKTMKKKFAARCLLFCLLLLFFFANYFYFIKYCLVCLLLSLLCVFSLLVHIRKHNYFIMAI